MSKHKGQRGFVFEVSASCLAMAHADRELGPLFVCFCRGRRQTISEGVYADIDGRAEFSEPLDGMMVTLYKDKKQPSFESKEYKFKLREAEPDTGKIRTLAVVTVDMSQHLNVEETSCPTLQLMMDADGVETAALMVDLSWSFVKDGKPDDDDVMSTQSAEEEIADGPHEIDASYRLPEHPDDDELDDAHAPQDTSDHVQMRFSVFLQEEGEEEIEVSSHPDWSLADVRNAASVEMEGRGLWVFLSDGTPIDPEGEDDVQASEVDILQNRSDEGEDEDEELDGLMDEEVREELIRTKKSEKRALRELQAIKRLLDEAEGGEEGDLLRAVRQEMEQAKQELADMQSTSEAELAAKTTEWQQAMDIGQDLLEKNRALQDELDDAQHTVDQLKAQLEPMESEVAQLKEIVADHEENSLLIEEERQGMEEQRYRISELERLHDMLEQELRDKEDQFEVQLQDELDQQKDLLEQKFQSELEWEQKKTEKALADAVAATQDSQQQEAADVEELRTQIAELQAQVATASRSLAKEQSLASAHKEENRKGQVALAEAKKEKRETLEKMKTKEAQLKKLQTSKEDSDKLIQAKTQEIQSLKKQLMVVRRDLSARSAELQEATKCNEELERKLQVGGNSTDVLAEQGGLMDMNGMAEMQSAIGAEYKAKYEGIVSAQKDKIKVLQSKNTKMQQKHDAELKEAERKGASVAMTKMAKAMKQAKKQHEKEAAKAQQQAERKHQKELRRAKAMALAQSGQGKSREESAQEGWLQKKGSKGFGKKGGKGWSWRWFVYKPKEHQLLYYEKHGPKMELKGTIEMKHATRVYVLDNKDQDKARQSFGVELPKRTYLLQAGDRKQMSKWVDFLSTSSPAVSDAACRKYESSLNGADKADRSGVAEGIPPETADATAHAQASMQRAEELVAKLASSSKIDPADAKEASSLSDQQVGFGNVAFKSKRFTEAASAARLALELDAENMEASSLLKKAEQALRVVRNEHEVVGTGGADGAGEPSRPRPTAKPLQSTKGMFEDDDDDDDDMFGD